MSTLPGRDIRNARGGILPHVVDLRVVVEQALGQDAGHGDVHAGQIALVVLEVPRRVGAAGADDELAAVERRAQHALGRGLRGRLLGVEHRARGEHGAGRGAEAEHVAALHEAVHVSSSFLTVRPTGAPHVTILPEITIASDRLFAYASPSALQRPLDGRALRHPVAMVEHAGISGGVDAVDLHPAGNGEEVRIGDRVGIAHRPWAFEHLALDQIEAGADGLAAPSSSSPRAQRGHPPNGIRACGVRAPHARSRRGSS